MSPLTKAFVILVTVLSVLLVALVVPFVARTQDFKGDITSLQQQLQSANEAARLRQQDVTTLSDQLAAMRAEAASRDEAYNARILELQGRLADEVTRAQTDRAKAGELQSSLARLSAAAQQDASLIETLRNELNANREELVTTRNQNIQLADRVVELESEGQALERQVRRLTEQQVAAQERLASIEQGLQTLPGDVRARILGGSTTAARDVDVNVQGQVTGVRDANGTTLVQIDLGSSDQIQQGHRLMVARGRDFIGTLVIEEVREREAAGRMTLQSGQVQEGDQVYGGQF